MKKLSVFLLLILCLFSLCSCDNDNDEKIKIFTSIYPIYSITQSIVGDICDVELLVRPGNDSHEFNVSAKDVIDVSNSDLFIYTSTQMEPWATDLVSKVSGDCECLNMKDILEQQALNGLKSELDEDPHIWTNPIVVKYMSIFIEDKISKIDNTQEHQSIFKNNLDNVLNRLSDIDNKFSSLSQSIPRLYFVCPFQFYHLLKHYSIKYYSLYNTCSEEVEPSAKDILDFENEITRNSVRYVVASPFSSRSILNRIVLDTNVSYFELNACENISLNDFENGVSIFDIFELNYNKLEEAFGGTN